MSPRPLALALACLAVVAVTACGKDPSSPTETPPAATTTSSPATSTSATPKSTLPPGVDQLVAIEYRNGRVIGPKGRVQVEQDSTVQIRVMSDVSDEVHLHGYDKSVDVEAGHTARLTFKADIPGVFEVELESRAKELTQLQVQ